MLLSAPRAHVAAVAALASISALLAGHLINEEASAAVALVCALARGAGAAASSPIALVAIAGTAALIGGVVAGLLRPRGLLSAALLGALLTSAMMIAAPAPRCAPAARISLDEIHGEFGRAAAVR
jgi:hypothetical protein